MLLFKGQKREQIIRNYIVPITSLLLILLSTGLYGENDEQPRWNANMFATIYLPWPLWGIGGSVGYNLTPNVGLEGEGNLILIPFLPNLFSGGVVIASSDFTQKKLCPYVVGGIALVPFESLNIGGMLGGGIKMQYKKERFIQIDIRFYFFRYGGKFAKFSVGKIWTF